jgi:hypothetical protein
MARTIIALHGVGDAVRGCIGSELATTLNLGAVRHAPLTLSGHAFLELRSEKGDRILELNWSDVLRPKATIAGALQHLWRLINCMVDVATQAFDGQSLPFARVYRWALFFLGPGIALVTLASVITIVSHRSPVGYMVLAALIGGATAGAWSLRNWGLHYRWLWLWIVGALAILIADIGGFQNLVQVAMMGDGGRIVRGIGFAGTAVFLGLAVLESTISWRKKPWAVRAAGAALLYVPYLVRNGITSWIVFLGLGVIQKLVTEDEFKSLQVGLSPGFNLRLLEMAGTIVFLAVSLWALALPAYGYWANRFKPNGKLPGEGARDGLSSLLTVSLIALVAMGLVSVWIVSGRTDEYTDILSVYTTSVLRTLPLLAWFAGPFAVVLDVAGDVMFYLQPNLEHPASIQRTCHSALSVAIHHALETANEGDEVVVLAHSQGSVIAAQVLADRPCGVALVTIGSPLQSLYVRFLGRTAPDAGVSGWVNGFREGDYIGGPIELTKVTNRCIGPGQHTGYWTDPGVSQLIATATGSNSGAGVRALH